MKIFSLHSEKKDEAKTELCEQKDKRALKGSGTKKKERGMKTCYVQIQIMYNECDDYMYLNCTNGFKLNYKK